jgi:hypothetical protein
VYFVPVWIYRDKKVVELSLFSCATTSAKRVRFGYDYSTHVKTAFHWKKSPTAVNMKFKCGNLTDLVKPACHVAVFHHLASLSIIIWAGAALAGSSVEIQNSSNSTEQVRLVVTIRR